MRGALATLTSGVLSVALATASLTVPRPALAVAPAAAGEDPRALYDEGRKAYRLGDFEAAVEKWERAYALSDKPLLLYNISLAYKGRYTISRDVADLRRSKAILDNFIKIADSNADVDLDDAPERMAELEALIAKAEEEAKAGVEPTPPPQIEQDPDDLRSMPEGEDPGRKFRIGGIASMGAGGGLLLIGGGVGIFYLIRSQQFSTDLRDANERLRAEECGQEDTLDASNDADIPCLNLYSEANTARSNGRQANTVGYISVGVLGGLGLVGLITGAVLFTEGNRRSRRWEQGIASTIRVSPTLRGLQVSGRF